jgi:LacI family transcriptional regulator
MSSLVTPALTTIRQPLANIGSWAVRLLVQQIEGNPPAEWSHRDVPDLVIRGSTGPPG